MAKIDDIDRSLEMLIDALIRGHPLNTTIRGMGQSHNFPGLAPSTYRHALAIHESSKETLAVVKEIRVFLTAVNVETLGRIERLLNAVNVETLGRIERSTGPIPAIVQMLVRIDSLLDKIGGLLSAVNDETLGRIETRITGCEQMLSRVEGQIKQDATALNSKLGAIHADIQALPH